MSNDIPKPALLLVEDDPLQWPEFVEVLSQRWDVHHFASAEDVRDAQNRASVAQCRVAVVDHILPGEAGASLCYWLKDTFGESLKLLMLSANWEPSTAEAARDSRIDEFEAKPVRDWDGFLRKLEWLHERAEANEPVGLKGAPPTAESFSGRNVFVDPLSKQLKERIRQHIGPSLMPVLIIGDTGTGKEKIAELIHHASGPSIPADHYQAVNCAAFTETLVMSELFGHVEGAFTDARENRAGLILEAAGATASDEANDQGRHPTSREVLEEVLATLGETQSRTVQELVSEFLREGAQQERGHFARRVRDAANRVRDILEGLARIRAHEPARSYREWLRQECGVTLRPNVKDRVYDVWIDGAETSAPDDKPPITGTLFLDEIGDLSPVAQGAVLRFLDGHGFRPVGYVGWPIRPMVRLIAATNKHEILGNLTMPKPDADDGPNEQRPSFRTDLLWRLGGWIIQLSPVNKRGKEALYAAHARVAEFNTIQGKNITLADGSPAEKELMDMIENGAFSDETGFLRHGNFRHLNWVIDRACWLTATSSPSVGEVPLWAVKAAAKPVDETAWIRSDDHQPMGAAGGEASVEERKHAVVQRAAFLGEDHTHDPSRFSEGDGSLQQDEEAVKALRDLFGGKHGLEIKKLFDDPVDGLGVRIANAAARKRWQYLCLLGVLAAAKLRSDKVLWKVTLAVIGGSRSTASIHAKKMMEQVLDESVLGVVWRKGTGTKGPGNIGDFLGLLAEPAQRILAGDSALDELPDEERTKTQFYWVKTLSKEERKAKEDVLTHLGNVARRCALLEGDKDA